MASFLTSSATTVPSRPVARPGPPAFLSCCGPWTLEAWTSRWWPMLRPWMPTIAPKRGRTAWRCGSAFSGANWRLGQKKRQVWRDFWRTRNSELQGGYWAVIFRRWDQTRHDRKTWTIKSTQMIEYSPRFAWGGRPHRKFFVVHQKCSKTLFYNAFAMFYCKNALVYTFWGIKSVQNTGFYCVFNILTSENPWTYRYLQCFFFFFFHFCPFFSVAGNLPKALIPKKRSKNTTTPTEQGLGAKKIEWPH